LKDNCVLNISAINGSNKPRYLVRILSHLYQYLLITETDNASLITKDKFS